MIMLSLIFSFFPRENETSFLNVIFINEKIFRFGLEVFQILIEYMNIRVKITIHEIENQDDLGSKTENRLVIIKSFLFFC